MFKKLVTPKVGYNHPLSHWSVKDLKSPWLFRSTNFQKLISPQVDDDYVDISRFFVQVGYETNNCSQLAFLMVATGNRKRNYLKKYHLQKINLSKYFN